MRERKEWNHLIVSDADRRPMYLERISKIENRSQSITWQSTAKSELRIQGNQKGLCPLSRPLKRRYLYLERILQIYKASSDQHMHTSQVARGRKDHLGELEGALPRIHTGLETGNIPQPE